MDKLILNRKLARRRFTLCANKLQEYIKEKEISSVCAEFKKLSAHHDELLVAQNKYFNSLLEDETRDEQYIEKESDSADEYESRWYHLEQMVKDIVSPEEQSVCGTVKVKKSNTGSQASSTGNAKRCLRLPKLELPRFNGDIQRWLPFWAQFRKIDADETIDKEDKFQYLIQSMEVGTSARELVESFPPSAENYPKVIEQLKQRFARDDLLTEHYVRELLQLTVSRAKSPTNLSLRYLYDKIMTQIMALESLGVVQEKYAAFLFPLVESALPTDILRAWSRSHLQREPGSLLSKLLNFLKLEVESEERIKLTRSEQALSNAFCTNASPSAACFATTSESNKVNDSNQKEHETDKAPTCLWCDTLSHTSSECPTVAKMSLEERRNFVKRKKACYVCLKVGHIAMRCAKFVKCIACGRRHYPIMCESLTSLNSKQEVSNKIKDDQTVLNQAIASSQNAVLLQTLMVKVRNGNNTVIVRALLDSAAQRSFVKQSLAESLNLKPIGQTPMNHTLFGGVVTQRKNHKLYELLIENVDGSNQTSIKVYEQHNICGHLPKVKYGSNIMLELQRKGVELTDHLNNVSEISLLIGSDFLGKFWIPMGRSAQVGDLLALETKLGWTVQGPTNEVYRFSSNEQEVSVQFCTSTFDVEDLWKLESLGIRDDSEKRTQSSKEAEVVDFFEQTITVNDEGRYEIKFPWIGTVNSLSTNFDIAERRLKSTTKKLIKLEILKDYDRLFEEWLDSDIIEEVLVDNRCKGHYLPHHAVVKESSLTTKIRLVFDASAVGKNGLSLNDCLEKGSNLIEQIPRLLINFRKGAIGITADIKKAFLQISVNSEDREFLKFLWWNDIQNFDKGLKTYRHRRVVFGVKTSPFLLSATILHHLNKYKSEVAAIMRESFYVDNLVISVNNVDEMNHFIKDAKNFMSEGKFELRCWVSSPILTDEENPTSVLGMLWDPKKDELYCKVPVIPNEIVMTKRVLLSLAQSIFDPLGFVCPVTLVPKLIIQECWIRKIDWDVTLPTDLASLVSKWLKNIEYLKDYKLPRHICFNDISRNNNSLHIFCDASQAAYSACVYLRSEFNSIVSVQLIIAKARVTPAKSISMPRLELIAALLGTRLASEVKTALKLDNCKEYFWTDASIVLAWIKRGVGFNMFVHNRVTVIIRKTSIDNWRHVPGDMNPADLLSRGCDAKQA